MNHRIGTILAFWAAALCLALTAFLMFVVNHLAMSFYQHAFGGKPLPYLTTVMSSHSIWPYFYFLPSLAIAIIAIRSTLEDQRSLFPYALAAVTFAICIIVIIAIATLLPAIPVYTRMIAP